MEMATQQSELSESALARLTELADQARAGLVDLSRYVQNGYFEGEERHTVVYRSTWIIRSIREAMENLIDTGTVTHELEMCWEILSYNLTYMDPHCYENSAMMIMDPDGVVNSRLTMESMIYLLDEAFPCVDSMARLRDDCERNIGFHTMGILGDGDHELYRLVKSRVRELDQFEKISNWAELKDLNALDDFLGHVCCLGDLKSPDNDSEKVVTEVGGEEVAEVDDEGNVGVAVRGEFYKVDPNKNLFAVLTQFRNLGNEYLKILDTKLKNRKWETKIDTKIEKKLSNYIRATKTSFTASKTNSKAGLKREFRSYKHYLILGTPRELDSIRKGIDTEEKNQRDK